MKDFNLLLQLWKACFDYETEAQPWEQVTPLFYYYYYFLMNVFF